MGRQPYFFGSGYYNIHSLFMNRLEISGVSKAYGKMQILNKLSLRCKTGEIIGLFGRNGSGKSTLLQGIMGTLAMDAIAISYNGKRLKPSEVIPKKITGYLPQDTFLPKEMKVRNVIPLMYPKGEDQDRIFYSAGVGNFENQIVGKLSAGQLKYLELLLLAHLPHAFLLLDEPFSMVEPQYIERIKELLLSLKTRKGLVVTDHYYQDVLEIADNSFVLKDGNLFEVENKEDLSTYNYLKSR